MGVTGAYSGTQGVCAGADRGLQGVQGVFTGADRGYRGWQGKHRGWQGKTGNFHTGFFRASSVCGNSTEKK